MDSLKSIDQLLAEGARSYPQKESSKEKTKVQEPIANRPIGYRTIGRVAQPSSPPITEVIQEEQATELKQQAIDESPLAKAERRSQSIKNLEIDEYLFGLVNEGLLDERFIPLAAKACHTLGVQKVNVIVIQVRQADYSNPEHAPYKLMVYKLQGALQLHYKKVFYQESKAREQ